MKRILLALAIAGALFAVPVTAQTVNGYGNFNPHLAGGFAISATTSSSSVTFSQIGINNTEVYIFNSGTTNAFAVWGVGAQTATSTGTGSIVLPPGSVQVFNKQHADTIAVIMGSGTGTIYVMSGQGN